MLCGTDCQVQTENSKLQFNAKKPQKSVALIASSTPERQVHISC